ncbi:MAG: CBS domain-containing protein [Acidimicrobiia bacterium]|nr:CBS domain-containing protein [Acidimicrobiia bacterium]MBT8215547.1 CBS domain-containing protein [Acidimicrobiia bacterium]NNF10978.1 CBS domain-containing protein [Acidimicrobiia bacterium]NNL70775.1 CBS domain-containing protein [Acidimicrobiia bacterium]
MNLEVLVGGGAEVVGPQATLREVAQSMVKSGVGSVGVIDGHELVGILTERDILRGVADDVELDSERAADFMTPAPDTFSPDVDVEEAASWLIETGYRHLPVMRDGELLGIASIRDLLWAMVEGD